MPSRSERFKAILEADGLWTAMRWLNESVPYRFTAVFAFSGDMLRNICLVDKEDAATTHCPDQPIADSYCIYIHRSGERFSVENALLEPSVKGHPKRSSYQCYYGIPLSDSDGSLRGTVCHFGIAPIRVTEDIVDGLDDVAPWIAEVAFKRSQSS